MRLKGTLSMLGPPGKWTGSAVFCATLTKSMLEFSFSQTSGGGEGQGSLACCSSWVCRVRHNLVTEQQELNVQAHPILVDSFTY